jgi:C-terminal processing protease CtpA/Prc
VTNERGEFDLRNLHAGIYSVHSAEAEEGSGSIPVNWSHISVAEGETVENVDLLRADGVMVSARILDAETNHPVPRAHLSISPNSGLKNLVSYYGRSDGEGEVRFLAKPGIYRLHVLAPKHELFEKQLVVDTEGARLDDVLLVKRPERVAADTKNRTATTPERPSTSPESPAVVVPVQSQGPDSPPRIVNTVPVAFANDVDPALTTITVTFDLSMTDRSWSWCGGGPTYPATTGTPYYDAEKRTCTLPVKLEQGKVYLVGINSPSYRGFRSSDGKPSAPYIVIFATKSADGKPTPIPAELAEEAKAVNAETAGLPRKSAPITEEVARSSFDQLWDAYDRQYAMFVLRPEVSWNDLRDQYRPKALACETVDEFAEVCAEMLGHLRDLHIWVKIGKRSVPVFNRPRKTNANPWAYGSLIGEINESDRRLAWGQTKDKIGFIAIHEWSGEDLPDLFDKALEEMRDTRGLVIDVRSNGGGSEPLAQRVAGRFADREITYSYSQYRNGPKHTDLSEKNPRTVGPGTNWRYERPVILLIGERCMSSNESFVAMMAECPQVTTMGAHTCGSSGNPRMLELPVGVTVSLPRWIDLLPDGEPLDERGVQPDVPFDAEPEGLQGERDDVLAAALERLRQVPEPVGAIATPEPIVE